MNDMMPFSSVVDIGESEIPYLYYEGDGAPLLLHATGFNPWLWHPIARRLKGRFQIYCPYFCDHRAGEPEAGGIGWMHLARHLARFCESLDLDSPHMTGHSMGGAVITIAAGRFGLAPARMLLIEPILLPPAFYQAQIRVEDHPLAGKSIKRRNQWQDRKEARAYLESKPLFQTWDAEMLEVYLRYGMTKTADGGGLELSCHPRKEAALFMGSMAYDPWPLLPHITCPVCVLEGENTENKGFIDFRKAAATFPNGSFQEVAGVGHLIPMEAPEWTAAFIDDFFGEEGSRRKSAAAFCE